MTSSGGTIILNGSNVFVNCTVKLDPAVMESELSLLMVDVQLSRDGTPPTLSDPTVTGTTFTYTTQLNTFGRNDSGNYICTATIRSQLISTYFIQSSALNDTFRVTIGDNIHWSVLL